MSAGKSGAGAALPKLILLCSISLKNEMSFDSMTIETRLSFQTKAADPSQRGSGFLVGPADFISRVEEAIQRS
jgi:hypothetical protein